MSNPSDALIWESAPRTFGIGSPGNILRCPADIAPKRISESKLAASMARAAFVPYKSSIRSGPVICPDEDKTLVRSLLRDLPLVTFLSSDWSSVMKWLTKITTTQVATVVGPFPLQRDPDLERFAEGLIRFNPHWQRLAIQEAAVQIDRLILENQAGTCVIAEERPGKLVQVEPRLHALRHTAKKYAQSLSRDVDIKTRTVLAETGWGAGSLVVEPEGERHIACCEFDISGRELHLAAAECWTRRIQNWVQRVSGISSTNFQQVEISTPYLVIAGYLTEAFTVQGQDIPIAPDLIWGWQPLLTLLDFLAHAREPSLLINLHHGSGMQVALIW